MDGEKIFEFILEVTGVADCGVTLESVLSGTTPIPSSGIRLDVAFEGRAVGRVTGQVRGVDYIRVRADGRMDLDIRSVIETDDGHRIALSANGVATPHASEPVADLFENIALLTAATEYQWVNSRQVWGVGTVNFATGKLRIDGYLQ